MLSCKDHIIFFPNVTRIRTNEDQDHKQTVYLLHHKVIVSLSYSSQRFSPSPLNVSMLSRRFSYDAFIFHSNVEIFSSPDGWINALFMRILFFR